MSIPQMQEAAKLGAKIEFVYNSLIGPNKMFEMADYVRAIHAVGPENCVISSDLGQAGNPLHADELRAFIKGLLDGGFSQAEIDLMAKKNPLALLAVPLEELADLLPETGINPTRADHHEPEHNE